MSPFKTDLKIGGLIATDFCFVGFELYKFSVFLVGHGLAPLVFSVLAGDLLGDMLEP
jgi:hypothetical protein